MPEETPQTKTVSRSFGISIGVTETIYLLGLLFLATGICLALDVPTALIVVGVILIFTALRNASDDDKGNS